MGENLLLEQARRRIERGELRKGLAKLEDACWRLSSTNTLAELDEIRDLADEVAGQHAQRQLPRETLDDDLSGEDLQAHVDEAL